MTDFIGNAADALEGRILKDRWIVQKKILPSENSTGGFFSVCYIVTDGVEVAFLKALNFIAFFQLFRGPGKSMVDILSEQTNAFKYEKELLLRCRNNNLSKVSIILDEGEEHCDGFLIATVPYLIFEMADGDLRSKINFNNQLDIAWKLNSLHNVAVGLQQLHSVGIGHQDMKPSNVLLYENGTLSKIADLGRSLCRDIHAPHDEGGFPGDFKYAPPECLYGYLEQDWTKRVKATDLYLFGSLVVFYFTGISMTSLLGRHIDSQFNWNNWGGSFEQVKVYLTDGFYKAINEFKTTIHQPHLAEELGKLVVFCCYPDPNKRGHPKSISENGNQYNLQRVISKMDLLHKQHKYYFK